jgi:hypothetical protein
MIYYEIRDCSGVLSNRWTDSDLAASGLILGSFFQSQEYPGVCWEIITIVDEDAPPGPTETITHVGPIFVNCTDCNNGVVNGCTDPTACNFDPCATIDDGSCFYNNVTIRILCNDPITTCDINANCN